jgi:hypothetical protein
MLAEFSGYSLHFTLGVREHGAIVRRFNDLVGGPRLREAFLKLPEIVRANGTALSAKNNESHRSIEPWYLRFGKRARNFLRQPKTCDPAPLAITLFHIVINLYFAIPHHDVAR